MSEGPRGLAVELLRDVSKPGTNLQVLENSSPYRQLSDLDRGFLHQLVLGVLRHRSRLDYEIAAVSRRPLEKLDDVVRWILRVGLFQVRHLRVADWAAVNETVSLCRRFRVSSAASFVNGVLRHLIRNPQPLPRGDSPLEISIRTSHPEWLVRRYLNRFGRSRALFMLEKNNTEAPPFFWISPFRCQKPDFLEILKREGVAYQDVPDLPQGVLIQEPAFPRHRLYREGFGFFMDASSQQVMLLPGLDSCRRVADLCAGTGNKSFLLRSRLNRAARLLSMDLSLRKVHQARRRARLHGVPRIDFVAGDAARELPFRVPFDFLLVDVPCSGLGTLRSNPDIRWKIDEEDLSSFRRRQRSILCHAFKSLKPGGELLYVTCSTEPEENDEVVEFLMGREQQAQLVGDAFRTFPGPGDGDYFYASRVRHLDS